MYKLIRPIFFAQDSEKIHDQIKCLGRFLSGTVWQNLIRRMYDYQNQALGVEFLGIKFKNPIGLAAGFDKNGELLEFLPSLGFGFLEIGSITAQAREGNPKPRLFRLVKDQALINRMGLNNRGADVIYGALKDREFKIPVGVNIAKTHDPRILGHQAIADFIYSFKRLHTLGDYIVFNISCPNTAEGKTFEEKEALTELLSEVRKVVLEKNIAKPILVKISPDVSFEQLDAILDISESFGVSGYIISNISMKAREWLKTGAEQIQKIGKTGGVSGRPIRQRSTELISYAYRRLKRPCIIGLGGVDSAETAYEKIKAGASLVQIYTGLIYEGPGLVKKINQGLVELLGREGFRNISEAVGKA
jgi:dihydroorotate dehydrogenase